MHSISTGPAIALAEQVFWKDIHHILDVGAGSGALSIALLQTYPHIKATLMDIPSVCNIASQYLLQYGVHERSEVIAFDMFSKTSLSHRTRCHFIFTDLMIGILSKDDCCYKKHMMHSKTEVR